MLWVIATRDEGVWARAWMGARVLERAIGRNPKAKAFLD